MRIPSLLSGPKIRKAYFEASYRKMLIHRPPLKSDFKGVIEVSFFDLKPQSRLYELLVQIKVMEFSFALRTGGRVKVNFLAPPYGVAFLNP